MSVPKFAIVLEMGTLVARLRHDPYTIKVFFWNVATDGFLFVVLADQNGTFLWTEIALDAHGLLDFEKHTLAWRGTYEQIFSQANAVATFDWLWENLAYELHGAAKTGE